MYRYKLLLLRRRVIYNIIKNEEGIRLTNNIIIIQIYIPNLRKKWYNKEKLNEEERYALGLVEPNKMKSLELGKDIDIMEEYVEEAEEVMEEEYFGESYEQDGIEPDFC